jgi:hypothetical protein
VARCVDAVPTKHLAMDLTSPADSAELCAFRNVVTADICKAEDKNRHGKDQSGAARVGVSRGRRMHAEERCTGDRLIGDLFTQQTEMYKKESRVGGSSNHTIDRY